MLRKQNKGPPANPVVAVQSSQGYETLQSPPPSPPQEKRMYESPYPALNVYTPTEIEGEVPRKRKFTGLRPSPPGAIRQQSSYQNPPMSRNLKIIIVVIITFIVIAIILGIIFLIPAVSEALGITTADATTKSCVGIANDFTNCKANFCTANPTDPRCITAPFNCTGVNNDFTNCKANFCTANPTDPRCATTPQYKWIGKFNPGDIVSLKADSGYYLTRCNCISGVVGNQASLHVADGTSPETSWKLVEVDPLTPKVAFQNMVTGLFLSECSGCIPGALVNEMAFVKDATATGAWDQWSFLDMGNGKYGIQNLNNYKYLGRCSGCVPNNTVNFASVKDADTSGAWAQWTITKK